jgi:predicted metal-binding membrane protein
MNTQTSARAAPAATALTVTLGLAAVAWAVAVRQMSGMDMGPAACLGSAAFFAALWVPMMAAMMLPGAAPAAVRIARDGGGARAVPLFLGSYLAVWALAGAAVYLLYRPHGTLAAGLATITAGLYELTPVKARFRRRGQEDGQPGWRFGLCCLGSTAGLMLILLALSVMSIGWMAVLSVLALAQKLLPPRPALDVPVALAIIALGVLVAVAPSVVPGLTPPMPM